MPDQSDIPEEFRSDEDLVFLDDLDLDPKMKEMIEAGTDNFYGTAEEEQPIVLNEDPTIAPWDIRLLGEKGWHELEEWVEWLRGAYRLDNKILACWWRHISISMELAALKASWDTCYGPTANLERPSGPGEWHHYLDLALSRMERHWNGSCSSTHEELNEPGESKKRQLRPTDFNIAKAAFENKNN